MISVIDADASASSGSNVPLSVGTGWQPGDLRIVKLTRSTSDTLGTASGWDRIHAGSTDAVSRYLALYTRTLQAGDVDSSVVRTGGSGGYSASGITLRGWEPGQTLLFDVDGGPSGATSTAPSLTAPGPGLLITFHDVTITNGMAQNGPLDAPTGMTLEASSLSDQTNGYNVVTASLQVLAGDTGPKSTTFASGDSGWSGTSLFIAEGEIETGPGPTRFFLVI